MVTTVSDENIYKLNGRVPLKKAIPFGLQHVLAMFVANLAPVIIVCGACAVSYTHLDVYKRQTSCSPILVYFVSITPCGFANFQ